MNCLQLEKLRYDIRISLRIINFNIIQISDYEKEEMILFLKEI